MWYIHKYKTFAYVRSITTTVLAICEYIQLAVILRARYIWIVAQII